MAPLGRNEDTYTVAKKQEEKVLKSGDYDRWYA